MKFTLALAALLLAVVPLAKAQTPTPPEGTWLISAGANYTTTTGGQLDNGSVETVQYHINDYFSARLDTFTLVGGLVAPIARVQPQAALSHLIKGNEFINTDNILPFANIGGGAVISPNGAGTHPAFAVGGGVDYKINSTVTIRALEFDFLASTIIPSGHTTLSNVKALLTGVYFTFPSTPSPAFTARRERRRAEKQAKKAQELNEIRQGVRK